MLERINSFIWGGPTLLLILGVGLYLTFRTGAIQFRWLPRSIKLFVSRCRHSRTDSGVSSGQALWTALAATVGTGNLAGVAGAIAIGGPGAVFWMWISALMGMVLKFAEATLSVHFAARNKNAERVAGPMYMIRAGLPGKLHWLAPIYAFFGVFAAFGVGNATQINTLTQSINDLLPMFDVLPSATINLALGCIFALPIAAVLLGGAAKIGSAAERLVPVASVLYIVLSVGVIILRADKLPDAMCAILHGAFRPQAVTGGMVGSVFQAMRIGVSRGVFTNEAGMGTAAIAHGAAEVAHPVQQGLMGIVEVFIDTILICTLTALVILCGGAEIPYGTQCGIALTTDSFSLVYGGWVKLLIAICICFFAFATILGWGLYGIRCAQFLLGENVWRPFALLQIATAIVSACLKIETVWQFAEIVNGLMAIPNLITLLCLSPALNRAIADYKQKS